MATIRIRTCASRGRADGDWYFNPHSQRLEIGDCISNAISSIAKDFMIIIERLTEDFVPTKTIKSPNFTLGKGEKRVCVYRHPSLSSITFRITNKKETQKNGKQKQKQSNQLAAAPKS